MIGNVSINSTTVMPQTIDKPLKESSNFNNLLKGKMEGGEGKTKVDNNPIISNDSEQKTGVKDGFIIDEVLSTISTKIEVDDSVDENLNLEEAIYLLAAMLEQFKNNTLMENTPNEKILNSNTEEKIGKISEITLTTKSKSVDLNGLSTILDSVEEIINNSTVNILDSKENISVIEELLKGLDQNLQELTNNIKKLKTSGITDPIKSGGITENTSEKILGDVIKGQEIGDIKGKIRSDNSVQGTNIPNIKEVIKEAIASNDIINKSEQLQTNSSDIKVEELITVVSSVRNEINSLLEVIKGPLGNDGTKVVNSGEQISELEVVKKFNLGGETSNNNSSKKENNSNGDTFKEDKILNSIIKEKEELPVSRFVLMNNNINTSRVANPTEVQSINKQTIVQDVIKSVKYMVTNGTRELLVKINPKELGEVVISLVQEGGALKASIKASSKDTYNLLAQNLNEIKKNLAEQNIKIQGVDISLKQEMDNYTGETFSGSTFQNGEESNRFRGNNRSNPKAGTDEEIEEGYYDEEVGNLNMLV